MNDFQQLQDYYLSYEEQEDPDYSESINQEDYSENYNNALETGQENPNEMDSQQTERPQKRQDFTNYYQEQRPSPSN